VHAAPAVSCAIGRWRRTRAYRAAEASDIPCAMALRLISCSPRSGRARCHRRRRNCFHQLDASIGASGPHDFTVRIRTIRQRRIHVHRIPSRACDDRETPLISGRDEIDIFLIWVGRQWKFLKIRNWQMRPRTPSGREVPEAEIHSALGRSGPLRVVTSLPVGLQECQGGFLRVVRKNPRGCRHPASHPLGLF
jgi:hypothetical protein